MIRAPLRPVLYSGYCTSSQAFFARATGLDSRHKQAYDLLFRGLVSYNIFSKIDVLHILATQDSTTALINLMSSSFAPTLTSAPTFTADRGYAGNSTNRVDSINPSTYGGIFTQNSCHIMVWGNAATTGDGLCQIANDAIGHIYCRFSDTKYYARVGASGVAGTAVASAHGFYVGNRSASNAWQAYKDGALITSGSDASSAPVNRVFSIPAAAGSSQTASVDQVSAFGFGSSLSADDVMAYNSLMRAYMTTMGVP